jgi:hypothetical protein
MDNPSLILSALDRRLDHDVRLVLYGRSAVCLGFNNPPPETANSQDVDAIISSAQSRQLEHDPGFWDAIEGANAELAARGLYITHLFSEAEIFLRRDWLAHLVPIDRLSLRHLFLSRPATVDLVLSKMMRGNDPQDMADAAFMIRHDRITAAELEEAFCQMKPIELSELRDAFAKAKPLVLQFTQTGFRT